MGRQKYLIDTNIAIDYIGEGLPEKAIHLLDKIIDGEFYISVINTIEILGFSDITEYEEMKFKEFINAAFVLNLDDNTVNNTIKLRRQYKIKLPDSIIAATAIVNELILITRNTKDFEFIKGLELINPYDIK